MFCTTPFWAIVTHSWWINQHQSPRAPAEKLKVSFYATETNRNVSLKSYPTQLGKRRIVEGQMKFQVRIFCHAIFSRFWNCFNVTTQSRQCSTIKRGEKWGMGGGSKPGERGKWRESQIKWKREKREGGCWKVARKLQLHSGDCLDSEVVQALWTQANRNLCCRSDSFLKRRGDPVSPFWSHPCALEV